MILLKTTRTPAANSPKNKLIGPFQEAELRDYPTFKDRLYFILDEPCQRRIQNWLPEFPGGRMEGTPSGCGENVENFNRLLDQAAKHGAIRLIEERIHWSLIWRKARMQKSILMWEKTWILNRKPMTFDSVNVKISHRYTCSWEYTDHCGTGAFHQAYLQSALL